MTASCSSAMALEHVADVPSQSTELIEQLRQACGVVIETHSERDPQLVALWVQLPQERDKAAERRRNIARHLSRFSQA